MMIIMNTEQPRVCFNIALKSESAWSFQVLKKMEEMLSTRVSLRQHLSHKIILLTIIKEDELVMNTQWFDF